MPIAAGSIMRRKLVEPHVIQFTRKCKIVTTVFCVASFLATVFFTMTGPPRPTRHPVYKDLTGGPIDLRRDLARDLGNVFRDLKRAKEHNQPPDIRSLQAIERTLGRLDPRMLPARALEVLAQQEKLSSGNGSDSEVEACPELYKGLEYDPPYHSHAFEAECNNKVPLKRLVTFLVDASLYTHSDLEALLEAIVSRYDGVKILVAVIGSSSVRVAEGYVGVKAVRVTASTPTSVRWSRMLRLVGTKYVLVCYTAVAFSPYTDVERLIRALRLLPHAAFVSGATRNETGHWAVECFQARLELYALMLREGYTASALECMYCDAVGGPFLTTLAQLAATPLDERLTGSAVFVDWFLRVRANGGLGAACPDVLFFTAGGRKALWANRRSWTPLAAKWGITDILLPLRHYHHFTCQEAKLSCAVPQDLAAPPCCLAFLGRSLRDVVTVLEATGLTVQVAESTVVGGVKGGLQPWQTDAHLAVMGSQGELRLCLDILRRGGFSADLSEEEEDPTYVLASQDLTLFLHPLTLDLQGDLPTSQRATPTRMHVAGAWLPAPPTLACTPAASLGLAACSTAHQGRRGPSAQTPPPQLPRPPPAGWHLDQTAMT